MMNATQSKLEHAKAMLASIAGAGAVLVVGFALTPSCSRPPENTAETGPTNPPAPEARLNQSAAGPALANPASAAPGTVPLPSPALPPAASAPPATRAEPTPYARQLVASLAQIDLAHGPLTAEQAATWKQTLKQLTEQGGAAVPAIREFLEKNTDLDLRAAEGSQALGWSSLRLALFDTLQNIGGPEATAALAQTLQTTADPVELATLAKLLDRSDPEKYRAAVLNAAKEALALAASGQWDGREVSPLFELIQHYGGTAADLEQYANAWFDYTPLTLAELPDGAGIPSLIRLAQNADGSVTLGQAMYQRVLAQTAAQFPSAADALVEQARLNRIDVSAWPGVAAALEGATLHLANPLLEAPVTDPEARSYHVAVGNQNYVETAPAAAMTADEIGNRIRLIDRLLGVTSNAAAIDALEAARIALSARLTAVKQ